VAPAISYAVILGGGKGERLRPLTETRPKPMLEVLGVPIVVYQLRWLRVLECAGW
jgi:NDP-sugar pyrophosphorylase family protein